MLRLLPVGLALASVLLVPAAPAAAASRNEIIRDCSDDGRLQGNYSPSELRDARKNLPSDVAEYTDCADVLRRAELPDRDSGGTGAGGGTTGAGGGAVGGPGGSGGEPLIPADDAERAALTEARERGGTAVEINGARIVPGASGLAPDAARNGIPDSVLIALAAIALLGAAAAFPALRRGPWNRIAGRSL